jgi:glycosyltransferase involved in cell wall biosynthesis
MQQDRKQQILHIIHGLTIGGAEVDLINKSMALARDYGYQITICCLMRRGPLAQQAEAQGIKVIGPLMRHRYDITTIWKLRRLILSQPLALIHTHLFSGNFVGFMVLQTIRSSQRPAWLAAEHAMADRWRVIHILVDRLIQRQAKWILVPSQASAESYVSRGLRPNCLRVISNSIDTGRFFRVNKISARSHFRREIGLSDEEYLIGTVCRLEPVKALPVLIEAIKSLPVRLVIVGDGSERRPLAALIEEKGLTERVWLLGHRQDIPQILAALDLFVLSSSSESFGIAVAEALLMKVPVITTNVGGVPEVICGQSHGQLVPPGNTEALTEAIQWAIDHPQQASSKAVEGCEYVRRTMSIEAVAEIQHEIYQEAFSQRMN